MVHIKKWLLQNNLTPFHTTLKLPLCFSSPHLKFTSTAYTFLRHASTPQPSPLVFLDLRQAGRQTVSGVDNLLLTLSCNKAYSCCHWDSGGQRERSVFSAQQWPRGRRGHRLGWQIVAHTPFILAPQRSACLTACLAFSGISDEIFCVCKLKRAGMKILCYY